MACLLYQSIQLYSASIYALPFLLVFHICCYRVTPAFAYSYSNFVCIYDYTFFPQAGLLCFCSLFLFFLVTFFLLLLDFFKIRKDTYTEIWLSYIHVFNNRKNMAILPSWPALIDTFLTGPDLHLKRWQHLCDKRVHEASSNEASGFWFPAEG